jgi:hypothetical protein
MLQKILKKGRTGGPEKLYSGTFQRLATPVSLVILDPPLSEKDIYS